MLALLDRRAVLQGALACLVLAGPAAVVLALADDDGDGSNWVLLVLGLVLAGYLLGGARAGRRARQAPFVNGAAAPLLVFVVIQVIGGIVRVVDGDGVNAIGVVFNLLLAASTGTVGAWLGTRRAA